MSFRFPNQCILHIITLSFSLTHPVDWIKKIRRSIFFFQKFAWKLPQKIVFMLDNICKNDIRLFYYFCARIVSRQNSPVLFLLYLSLSPSLLSGIQICILKCLASFKKRTFFSAHNSFLIFPLLLLIMIIEQQNV